MDAESILVAMQGGGWVLYLFPSTCRSYLIRDDTPRREVGYMAALRLVRDGLVTPWGPRSWRLAPAPV
jgi:hypothetical protein